MLRGNLVAPDPLPAATVVLLRAGLEVLLVKRGERLRFMAGAHVFPGGRVDPADTLEDERLEGLLGVPWAGAARVAAARELREETRLRLDAWTPWARWVTPTQELRDGALIPATRRYDTVFFVATWCGGEVVLDGAEGVEAWWARPAAALAAALRRDILLFPPTFRTLEELLPFSSPEEVLHAARDRSLAPITPHIEPGPPPVLTLPSGPSFCLEEGRWCPSLGDSPCSS